MSATGPAGSFESLPDGTLLTNQLPGLAFQNASVITAGYNLNELEFPPHSGSNIVYDNGGAMSITFASPVQLFAGYVTYGVPLTIQGFDSQGAQVVSATSRFTSNQALSGNSGSSPNEHIRLTYSAGISKVVITGAQAGASFALDDVVAGAVTVCDVNSDGATDITDIQAILNQALGVAPMANNLNGDNAVNVLDVQIVINAAVSGSCIVS